MITETNPFRGAWIWLRRTTDISPERARELGLAGVVIPAQTERGPVNRGPSWRSWCATFRRLGGQVAVMDWLPPPDRIPTWLVDLAAFARGEIGAVALMVDAEPDAGWRDAPITQVRRYALEFHRVARDCELRVAVTDYGSGGIGQQRLRILLGDDGISVPQSYDPSDPDGSDPKVSHARSLAYWEGAGATPERTVQGLGIWLRSERRHRTEAELEGHTKGIPEGVPAVCGWYGTTSDATEVLERSIPILASWAAERDASRSPAGAPPALRNTEPAPADEPDPPRPPRAGVALLEAEHVGQFFRHAHLPPALAAVSAPFAALAEQLVRDLPANPQRELALQRLLESKDAAVRARLASSKVPE